MSTTSFSNTTHMEEPFYKISELRPQQKSLNIQFIVLDIGAKSKTKEGAIITQVLIADATGSMSLSLWDDKIVGIKPGDIFILKGGYVG